jgi:hypothetical protein
MPERLIVTNGDSAVARMREAGIVADMLPWRDMLHDGPVPAGLALEDLSKLRAQYLADYMGLPRDRVERGFAERDGVVRDHGRFGRIELWFEHDLYDQLQLIQILALLSGFGRSDGVFLMQADEYLGPMSAEAMRALDGTARPVAPDQFAAARSAWTAFTATSPEDLPLLAEANMSPLPYLPAALRRLIAELPAVGSGLSLTEETGLSVLAEGPRTVGELFKIAQDQETARFLGDAPFFRRLDDLASCATPLLDGLPFSSQRCAEGQGHSAYRVFAASTVTLTEAGRAALSGCFDHAVENRIDRWLGGTHLAPESMWRRNSRSGGLHARGLQQ